MTDNQKIETALKIAFRFGQIDGSHHKMWVINQMVRALTGDDYATWIAKYEESDDKDDYYEWDTGIAP